MGFTLNIPDKQRRIDVLPETGKLPENADWLTRPAVIEHTPDANEQPDANASEG